eukprot:898143-Pyramimonas_sp.AAC.1
MLYRRQRHNSVDFVRSTLEVVGVGIVDGDLCSGGVQEGVRRGSGGGQESGPPPVRRHPHDLPLLGVLLDADVPEHDPPVPRERDEHVAVLVPRLVDVSGELLHLHPLREPHQVRHGARVGVLDCGEERELHLRDDRLAVVPLLAHRGLVIKHAASQDRQMRNQYTFNTHLIRQVEHGVP